MAFENMGDAVTVVIEYIARYNDCAKPHNALVEYERQRK